MFILTDPRAKGHVLSLSKGGSQRVAACQLMDIAPTLLETFGLPILLDMQGSVIRG